jgi:ABC1 atypical kinase-like domain
MVGLLLLSVRGKASSQGLSMMASKQVRYSSSISRSAPFKTYARMNSTSSSKLVPILAGGGSWCCLSSLVPPASSKCESAAIGGVPLNSEMAQVYQRALAQARQHKFHNAQTGWYQYFRRALRMFVRATKLLCTLAPVMALYPVWRLAQNRTETPIDVHELALMTDMQKHGVGPLSWYLYLCLACVEWSGAAVIKLMQWAGSRPDMFGHEFCAVFSRLQDNTTPHAWRHTEKVLREAYGDKWHERIKIHNRNKSILGSGCIGQVYKGVVVDQQGSPMEVAIKGALKQVLRCGLLQSLTIGQLHILAMFSFN